MRKRERFLPRVLMRHGIQVIILIGGWIACTGCSQPPSPGPVVATSRQGMFPASDPDLQWTTENAFPGAMFQNPVAAVEIPGRPGSWLVAEREGRIWRVDSTRPLATKHLALDLSAQTLGWQDCGLLNLVFHPELAREPSRRFVYVFYNYTTRPHAGPAMPLIHQSNWIHLSRFAMSEELVIDRDSELVLIRQAKPSIWHNGGGLAFGRDGFLYVGLGDEGLRYRESGDSFIEEEGSLVTQQISTALFSGVLRIDVDQRGGVISAPIRKQPRDGHTQGYHVPRDNPWYGQPGVLEEFYAIGTRSPHRMSLDATTGEIWIGDTGDETAEEVNLLARGANYGWSYREGLVDLRARPAAPIGIETDPIFHYRPLKGTAAIIGGFVYRGQRFRDQLEGRYVFGDNGTGQVFALARAPGGKVSVTEMLRLPFHEQNYGGLASLAQDHAGELYLVVLGENQKANGTVRRLVRRSGTAQARIPRTLSATGLFHDLRRLEPAAGMVPYWVNVPFWSDGTTKQRFLALPAGARILPRATEPWAFPAGTVVVKHFDLPLDEEDPSPGSMRRLETRVLVVGQDGGLYGRTYLWNDAQDDARIIEAATVRSYTIRTGGLEPLVPATLDVARRTLVLAAATQASGTLDAVLASAQAAASRFDGDFDVRVRVQGEGGLAVASGARVVLLHLAPRLVRASDGADEIASPVAPDVAWLRVRRAGDALAMFSGRDGVTWSELTTRELPAGQSTVAAYTAAPGARLSDLSALREHTHYFPGPSDCLVCHNEIAGGLLSLKSMQLNRDVPGAGGNQITAWQQRGILSGDIPDVTRTPALAIAAGPSTSLEHRVRSYLDTNCSFCHRPGGVVQVGMDLRFDTPLARQGLIDGDTRFQFGQGSFYVVVPKDRWRSLLFRRIVSGDMPPIGSMSPDPAAVGLVAEWINSLPGTPALDRTQISPPGGHFAGAVEISLRHPDPEASIRYTLDDSIPIETSSLYTRPLRLTQSSVLRARAFRDGFRSSVPETAHFDVVRPTTGER